MSARMLRAGAGVAVVGILLTALGFVVVSGEVDRADRSRVERPASAVVMEVQQLAADVDQLLATSNGVVAATNGDAARYTKVLEPEVKASPTIAGLAVMPLTPNVGAATIGQPLLLDDAVRLRAAVLKSTQLLAYRSDGAEYRLGFARPLLEGGAVIYVEVALPAPKGAPFELKADGAGASPVVLASARRDVALTRWNQPVQLGGVRLTLWVAADPGSGTWLGLTMPALVIVTGAALSLLAAIVAMFSVRRKEQLRKLGADNTALAEALRRQEIVETRLRASQARFRAVLRDCPDVVALVDLVHDSMNVLNRPDFLGRSLDSVAAPGGFTAIFGVESTDGTDRTDDEEMIGAPAADEMIGGPVSTDEHPAEELMRALAALSGHRVYETILELHDSDHSLRRLQTRCSRIADSEHTVLILFTDITAAWEEQQKAQALETALHRSQRLEAVGQLAGGIAHDFNNVLAAILSCAELIVEVEGTSGSPSFGYASEIKDSVSRGTGLTSKLLTFARRDASHLRPLELNEAVGELEQMLRRALGVRVELQCTLAASPSLILSDPTNLEQILVNLAVNARDAMPDGGTLWIATDNETDEHGSFVTLTVTDTGTGIAPEIAETLFDAFVTTKPPGQGTGLGLATVHSMVTKMRGTIDVGPGVGGGTTFRIRFPATTDAPAASTIPAIVEEPDTQGVRALLVDDDPSVRSSLRRLLADVGGLAVEVAEDATEAERKLERGSFDVVVTDVMLPGKNGHELAAHVRERYPDIGIVMISGYDPSEVFEDGDPSLVFLHKPFGASELLGAVASVLNDRDRAPAFTDPA